MKNDDDGNSEDDIPFTNCRAIIEKRKQQQQQYTAFAAGCVLIAHEIGAESTAVVVASIATSGVAIGAVLIGCLGIIMNIRK